MTKQDHEIYKQTNHQLNATCVKIIKKYYSIIRDKLIWVLLNVSENICRIPKGSE